MKGRGAVIVLTAYRYKPERLGSVAVGGIKPRMVGQAHHKREPDQNDDLCLF